MIEAIVAIVALAVGIAVGMVLGIAYRKKVTEAKIGLAEERAKNIVNEAEKVAETKKKEALIEAKEEILRSRNELEREIKERRNEVLRLERRAVTKEETLERKTEALEKKAKSLGIKIFDNCYAAELIKKDDRVCGILCLDENDEYIEKINMSKIVQINSCSQFRSIFIFTSRCFIGRKHDVISRNSHSLR